MGEGGRKGSLVGRLAVLRFYLRVRFKDLRFKNQAQHFSTETLGSSFGQLTANGHPLLAVSGFTLAVLMQMRGKQGALWEICKWRKANKMVTAWCAVYEYITDHLQSRIRSAVIRTPFLQAYFC